jgi:lysophospholipase L1-like esterase
MSKSEPSKIEKIDRNFAASTNTGDGLIWLDAFDPLLSFRGHGWKEEAIAARSFRRAPDRAAPTLSESVQYLTRCPASVFLSFYTDTKELSVQARNNSTDCMNHMPRTGSAGVELYVRDGQQWVALATSIPPPDKAEYKQPLLTNQPRMMREFRLYLPLYMWLEELSIGFSADAQIKPCPAPQQKPVFFYGTSITQGGCANTAGSDFVSILGRMLDTDTINFGFSGSGKGEPEVAQLIREVDASMFVLDYAANCTPELLRDTLPPFVDILREAHPETPIVIMGPLGLNKSDHDATFRKTCEGRRDVSMRFYLQRKDAGDNNIHFIDGEGLLPIGAVASYVDGVHPTSTGFVMIAERLFPQLKLILRRKREQLFL